MTQRGSLKTQPGEAIPEKLRGDIIRSFWMALGGRAGDLPSYLTRVLPSWREFDQQLAEGVSALLNATPEDSLTRGSDMTHPVVDERVIFGIRDLVRVEEPGEIGFEPIWSPKVKFELETLVEERKALKELTAHGLEPIRSAIFTGPPGVGKTLAAKWISRELRLPLVTLNLGSVMSSFLGRTGSNLREVMAFAAAHPCILFFDEVDAVAKKRDDEGDVGELKRLVTVLLQEIDQWPSTGLLVAATNHEQLLDPAVWRRFERRITFPFAGEEQMKQILSQLLRGSWVSMTEQQRKVISALAIRFSPSDVTQFANRAIKENILQFGGVVERLVLQMCDSISELPLRDRKAMSKMLLEGGFSQREVSRLTGLARETIRLNRKSPNDKGMKK